jgi:hypothetical protein
MKNCTKTLDFKMIKERISTTCQGKNSCDIKMDGF